MTLAVGGQAAEGVRVEFRCPVSTRDRHEVPHPGPLFAVMVVHGGQGTITLPQEGAGAELTATQGRTGGVIEIACQRCKQRANRTALAPVRRVIHRYSFSGELLETLTEAELAPDR
jgi:hypothetical protein